jgi:hypothetical protein
VLLEQGTPILTRDFPEAPDPADEPLYQLPSASLESTQTELHPDEVHRFMRVFVKKLGGEHVPARVMSNLGDGYVVYRPEIRTADSLELGNTERVNFGVDAIHEDPCHQLTFDGVEAPQLAAESLPPIRRASALIIQATPPNSRNTIPFPIAY